MLGPLVNDVATDVDDPPQFLDREARPLRRPELVRRHYGDLRPLDLRGEAGETYRRALALARRLGWQITHEDPATLVFQAVVTTPVLRFRDDLAVRVRPTAQGARVDVRSRSRVGRRDFGTNARRIRGYLAALGG